jgi:phosphomannomutase
MASTPAMFMSTVFQETSADGAVMITASHLPWDRNGFKYFSKSGGLDKRDIAIIIDMASSRSVHSAVSKKGTLVSYDLTDRYTAHLRQIIRSELGGNPEDSPLEGLHVVCDAGNGAGGFYATQVLQPLGADTGGSQFLEPDGHFPNHSPNPEDPEAMRSVSQAVRSVGADLGILFDTDVDRSAAVDPQGREIARNRIVALAAALIVPRQKGSIVVTDSVTSEQLTVFLEKELQFQHLRFQRGYRNVINKAMALNAAGFDSPLAIETSGHAAYRENYFLDDGAYLATKIVIRTAQLKREGKGIGSVIAALKEPVEAAEFRIPINAEGFSGYVDGILQELNALIAAGECSKDNPCNGRCRCGMQIVEPNYEGIRVSCNAENGDGWFLLRKSLHEPLMPVNIESNQPGGFSIIAKKVADLLDVYSALDLTALRSAGA